MLNIGSAVLGYLLSNSETLPTPSICDLKEPIVPLYFLADLNKPPLKTRRGRFGLRKRMAVRLNGFNVSWRKVGK